MEHKQVHSGFLRLRLRPWGLITTFGLVACVATVAGFCGSWGWLLDLFSHFRVQYFLVLLVAAGLLLIPRKFKTAACFALFSAVNLGVIVPLYLGSATPVEVSHSTLRAMLLNVNTQTGDVERVAAALRDFDPDIVVLEEISSKWADQLRPEMGAWPHQCIRSREDNFGIGLFSKLPFERAEVVYIGDADVPSIVAEIRAGPSRITVVATHPLPPAGAEYSRWRNDQIHRLPAIVKAAATPLLLLGDLNVTPWNRYFMELLERTGLRDSSQGRGVQPTWPAFNPLLLIPIDHCLHSADIRIVGKVIGPAVGSDHYPVVVDFFTL